MYYGYFHIIHNNFLPTMRVWNIFRVCSEMPYQGKSSHCWSMNVNCWTRHLFIQKYWKQLITKIIAFSNKLDPNLKTWLYVHISLIFLFRHNKVQKFCFQSDIRSNLIKMLVRRISSVKVFFEKFPWWLLLLNRSMAPISFLTWHLKKSGKRQVW